MTQARADSTRALARAAAQTREQMLRLQRAEVRRLLAATPVVDPHADAEPQADAPLAGLLRRSPAAIAQAGREVLSVRRQVERDLWGLEAILDRWQSAQPPHRNQREAVVAIRARRWR